MDEQLTIPLVEHHYGTCRHCLWLIRFDHDPEAGRMRWIHVLGGSPWCANQPTLASIPEEAL